MCPLANQSRGTLSARKTNKKSIEAMQNQKRWRKTEKREERETQSESGQCSETGMGVYRK